MNRDILLYRLCPVHRIYDCCNSDTNFDCKDCIRVMNERLDEYDNHVIEQYKANTRLNDTIREIHDNVAQEMYCKGIDDFAAYIREKVLFEERWLVDCKSNNANTNIAFSSIMTFINSVAEELKKVEIQ